MNSDGIFNNADFRKGDITINRSDYVFPEESGVFVIEGVTVCRYWGKRKNLILLLDSLDGRKLKFSFWSNTKYCCEPSSSREVDVEKESVRYLKDGSSIILTCEKSKDAKITRIRNIEIKK
ncbi:DNA topoisomerase [Enterococcus faecium]|nr:DNA topoisomerase [Enterococcus faecium]